MISKLLLVPGLGASALVGERKVGVVSHQRSCLYVRGKQIHEY
ncbi:hypothetical protein OIU79_011120 [Salix purpurea]|uniref:Uncharacterized protein n=1 Tax=Salix purpurea TaxID=77065 RepID=A0A9Q0T9T3_SALPP|nr:hypothetical protein OIU79_011120 [Salix purpurea]